jgi:hypothetical protein
VSLRLTIKERRIAERDEHQGLERDFRRRGIGDVSVMSAGRRRGAANRAVPRKRRVYSSLHGVSCSCFGGTPCRKSCA